MPAEIEVRECCPHVRDGSAEVQGAVHPELVNRRPGYADRPWKLVLQLCAECGKDIPAALREAVARCDPFDEAGTAKRFLDARAALDAAAVAFEASEKFGDACQLGNAAIDYARAKRHAPPEAAGN